MTDVFNPTNRFDPFGAIRKNVFTMLLVRGILGVLFGLLLLIAPQLTIMVLAITLGIWLIIDGISLVAMSISYKNAHGPGWGWVLAAGIVTALAGVVVLIYPVLTTFVWGLVMLWILAIGAIVRGVTELVNRVAGGWGIALGIIDILFGIVMVVILWTHPVIAFESVIWVVGIYALVFGIYSIIWAIMVKKQNSSSKQNA